MSKRAIKILYVDDDPGDVELVKSALEQTCVEVKYHLVLGEHGDHAIDLLHDPHYDIVILDYNLPGKNGIEVLEHIRMNPVLKHLPVLFLSGLEMESVRKRALELGIDGFFYKPFDFQSFMEIFKKICHEWFIPLAEMKA